MSLWVCGFPRPPARVRARAWSSWYHHTWICTGTAAATQDCPSLRGSVPPRASHPAPALPPALRLGEPVTPRPLYKWKHTVELRLARAARPNFLAGVEGRTSRRPVRWGAVLRPAHRRENPESPLATTGLSAFLFLLGSVLGVGVFVGMDPLREGHLTPCQDQGARRGEERRGPGGATVTSCPVLLLPILPVDGNRHLVPSALTSAPATVTPSLQRGGSRSGPVGVHADLATFLIHPHGTQGCSAESRYLHNVRDLGCSDRWSRRPLS